jgi:hypothetical protein
MERRQALGQLANAEAPLIAPAMDRRRRRVRWPTHAAATRP